MFSLPPTNHFACGGCQSSTVSQGRIHSSSPRNLPRTLGIARRARRKYRDRRSARTAATRSRGKAAIFLEERVDLGHSQTTPTHPNRGQNGDIQPPVGQGPEGGERETKHPGRRLKPGSTTSPSGRASPDTDRGRPDRRPDRPRAPPRGGDARMVRARSCQARARRCADQVAGRSDSTLLDRRRAGHGRTQRFRRGAWTEAGSARSHGLKRGPWARRYTDDSAPATATVPSTG